MRGLESRYSGKELPDWKVFALSSAEMHPSACESAGQQKCKRSRPIGERELADVENSVGVVMPPSHLVFYGVILACTAANRKIP
jgi:hypothetical protein